MKIIKKIIILIIVIICLYGIIYNLYKVLSWRKDIKTNYKIQDQIKKNIKINSKDNLYEIDFNSLLAINPDTVAYLKVKKTNIDYVVVKGTDNKFYLNHNFNKEENIAGWVFADYHNRFDGTDRNIVIYGHNTRDGSMFDTLKNVLNKDWYEDNNNHKILLITENGIYNYQVFSTYKTDPEDYSINTLFKSNKEFKEFVDTLKEKSIYNYQVDVKDTDNILTLSSCLGNGEKRVVLHAKLMIE